MFRHLRLVVCPSWPHSAYRAGKAGQSICRGIADPRWASSPPHRYHRAAMKVICGLGNPGERYRLTRHNVGFRVVDLLADRWALTGQGRVRDGAAQLDARLSDPVGRVLLVKPMKFMNLSGGPLRAALRQRDLEIETDLLVVADDVDLPLGRIRLRRAGSAGGHNGLRDIIEALGTDQFARLRVGIGRGGETVAHVLSTFRRAEGDLASEAVTLAADAAELWLREGTEAAMNAFNGVDLAAPADGA
jgi:peptidyl-tRNA hydrolase, PTH1 family